MTYAELDLASNLLKERLIEVGVGRGHRVAIYLPKSLESVVGIFGALKAGGAYVPVDVTAPVERCAFVMGDCAVTAIITDEAGRSALNGHLPAIRRTIVWEHGALDKSLWIIEPDWPMPVEAAGSFDGELAYILYTSGSTGRPKGVVHTHRSALSFIDWCSEVIEPVASDRFSSHAPFHFDLSIFDLYVPIKHGATVVLIDEELGKQPMRLMPFIADQRITVWYSTPSILRLLIDYGKIEEHPVPDLRTVVFAGEVFPLKYLRRLQEVWTRPRYFNFYGPTETNVCTYFEAPVPIPDGVYETLPIGYVCSSDAGRVVDPDGKDVEVGEEGELVIAGGSVMQGYWNLPERNAAAFLSDSQGRRWYRTGDIVREHPTLGYQYIGRRDRMVKRRGYRVELGEIEAALYRHESIAEAAVVAKPDPESGVRIHAFVAWSGPTRPSGILLKKFAGQNLPPYMIPDSFVFLDRLPKTSTDKIDYQRLASSD